MRIPSRVLLAGCGIAALSAPAIAAGATQVSLENGTLAITASAGDDQISIGSAGSNALGPTTSVNGDDMQAGPGCQGVGDPNGPANDGSVFCPTTGIVRIQVTLLGGDDTFANGPDLPGSIDAGPGDDEVDAGRGGVAVLGGSGEDEITVGGAGSDGPNTVDGGPDDDDIDIGRAGAADVVSGGGGFDTVRYASHAAVAVTLNDLDDDGAAGERDNVRSDVERVVGSGSGDTLIGGGGDDTLDGAAGDDRLEGRGGDDTLIGGPGVDTLLGGPGDDSLMLRDGITDACPDGGSGANVIDLDLADQFVPSIISGATVRRICLSPALAALVSVRPGLTITFRAVNEGPVSRLSFARPAIVPRAARVRVRCPAVLRTACRGRVRVATRVRGGVLGEAAYRVRAGSAALVVVRLSRAGERAARARRSLVLISGETGRSRLGPKTAIVVAPLRRR